MGLERGQHIRIGLGVLECRLLVPTCRSTGSRMVSGSLQHQKRKRAFTSNSSGRMDFLATASEKRRPAIYSTDRSGYNFRRCRLLLGFKKQFEAPIRAKTKRHTIRAKRKRRPKPGETCHCYVGLRQKGARLLGRWPCIQVQDIIIAKAEADRANIWIDGHVLAPDEREALARADGFDCFSDMMEFWKGRLPFAGDIIHWNPDGYGEKPR